jgi:hypothetical protein
MVFPSALNVPVNRCWKSSGVKSADCRAFPALSTEVSEVYRACGVIVLQGQLSLGICPRAGTGIRHAVGRYDLGRDAAAPLGTTWLVRQRLSDQGKSMPLGLGFLDSSAA